MPTVLQLTKGYLLNRVTEQKGTGDALDFLVHKDWRETSNQTIEIKTEVVAAEFKDTNAYGEVAAGEIASGAVTHSTDRTYPSWAFSVREARLIGEIVDPKEFKLYGISEDFLNSATDKVFATDDNMTSMDKIKAYTDKLEPLVVKLQKKLWVELRSYVTNFFKNAQTVGSLEDWQLPFGDAPVNADPSTIDYYKFQNLYSKAKYDEALNTQLYDAFANDQVDVDNVNIMQSAPYIFLGAKNFHESGKIFSPEKSVNVYHRGDGDLLDLVSADQRMIGSYQDSTAANANDFVMLGPLFNAYMLGYNENDAARNGIQLRTNFTPAGGLQITMKVTCMYVVESGIDMFKNKGTV